MDELVDRSLNGLALSFHGPSDIAEHAAEIGNKFEKLIADHDLADQLNPLMKHVIYLLEQIDLLTQIRNDLQLQGEQQHQRILQLEFEKKERKKEKQRFQTEYEQIEENYRQENGQLMELVNKLKEENQRLMNIINQEESNRSKYESSFNQATKEVNTYYQDLLANEKKKTDNMQKELDFRIKKCDKLDEEIEKKTQHQLNLREMVQQLKAENTKLLQQKMTTEQELQHQLDLINTIKQQLSCTIKSHLDEQQTMLDSVQPQSIIIQPIVSNPDTNSYLDKQQQHLQQLQIMQKQLATLSITAESTVSSGETLDSNNFQQKLQQQLQELQKQQLEQQNQLLSVTNSPMHQSPIHRLPISKEILENGNSDSSKNLKALPTSSEMPNSKIYESSHPPSKFTLAEIRNIWLERNNLQEQVKNLKRQLKQMQRSRDSSQSPPQNQNLHCATNSQFAIRSLVEDQPLSTDSESCDSEKISLRSFGRGENGRLTIAQVVEQSATGLLGSGQEKVKKGKRREDDDLPVQGPINREPDEKLYPYKRNSILSSFFPSVKWSRLRLN